jgi:hypothetical protein
VLVTVEAVVSNCPGIKLKASTILVVIATRAPDCSKPFVGEFAKNYMRSNQTFD